MSLHSIMRSLFPTLDNHVDKSVSEQPRKDVQEASHRLANQSAQVQAVARVLKNETDALEELVKDMH